ncbi:hypothetical protein JL39_03055 [Rhizobium sp. YS-1r]|nr:hypothetical protein JL39_03055 [Rhizobium sp. YS-1r]
MEWRLLSWRTDKAAGCHGFFDTVEFLSRIAAKYTAAVHQPKEAAVSLKAHRISHYEFRTFFSCD